MMTAMKKICMFHLQGKCKNGDACKFIHVNPPIISDPTVCKFFVTSFCKMGNKCRNKHDENVKKKYFSDL